MILPLFGKQIHLFKTLFLFKVDGFKSSFFLRKMVKITKIAIIVLTMKGLMRFNNIFFKLQLCFFLTQFRRVDKNVIYLCPTSIHKHVLMCVYT
jgi:hypothetical protein